MNDSTLQQLQLHAQTLGFDLVGVASARQRPTREAFVAWLERHYHGEMDWMHRAPEKRCEPRRVLQDAQTILSFGVRYHLHDLPSELLNDPSRGIIARYALIDDYHTLVLERLQQLEHRLHELFPMCHTRSYVDTGPLLERDLATEAGLGFIGRNSQLIHPDFGSYLFLGEILTNLPLPLSPRDTAGTCGACQRCKQACPTHAIIEDRRIDARRCISYLTIELKGIIPEPLRPLLKNRIYGCDICQEVCPWNKKAQLARQQLFQLREDLVAPKLIDLARMTEQEFRERFRHSPIRRAKYHGLLRNVAVALGNWGNEEARPLLERLSHHAHPLVQHHATWGLAQLQPSKTA